MDRAGRRRRLDNGQEFLERVATVNIVGVDGTIDGRDASATRVHGF